MTRKEIIKRFILITQMWGYFRHQKPATTMFDEMDKAIKGEVTFDSLAEAYNRLYLDDKWVHINSTDLENYNKLMSMTEEEFADEYYEVEGYYYE